MSPRLRNALLPALAAALLALCAQSGALAQVVETRASALAGAEPPAATPSRGKKAARPFAGMFEDYFAFDGTRFYDTEGGGAGSFDIGITYEAFRELLKRQPDSQGYVGRGGRVRTRWAEPGALIQEE